MSSSLPILSAAAETHRELPMPPIVFGGLALLGFLMLLGILWFFRGTAQRIAVGATGPGAYHDGAAHGDHSGSHH